MGYQVAIPSYQRVHTLANHTLPLLTGRGVRPDVITVFVADTAERDRYREGLDASLYREIVVAAPGLDQARNFINRHYPANTHLVQADDDLRDVVESDPERPNKLRPVSNLDLLFRENFTEMQARGLTLWGVGAVPNRYFMQDGYSDSLKLCVGALWGVRNDHAPHNQVSAAEKEDYERTLRHWDYAGGVLRRNDVAVVTKFYTEPGGMQATRRINDSADAARRLMAEWPDLVRINHRRKGPHTEVLLSHRRRRIHVA